MKICGEKMFYRGVNGCASPATIKHIGTMNSAGKEL